MLTPELSVAYELEDSSRTFWGQPVMKTVVVAQLDERISGAILVTQTLSGAPRRVRLPRRIP